MLLFCVSVKVCHDCSTVVCSEYVELLVYFSFMDAHCFHKAKRQKLDREEKIFFAPVLND